MTAHFDRWAQRVDFVFGTDANQALRSRAEAFDEACWAPARTAAAPPRSGARRWREPNRKRCIVTERGYLHLELTGENLSLEIATAREAVDEGDTPAALLKAGECVRDSWERVKHLDVDS